MGENNGEWEFKPFVRHKSQDASWQSVRNTYTVGGERRDCKRKPVTIKPNGWNDGSQKHVRD